MLGWLGELSVGWAWEAFCGIGGGGVLLDGPGQLSAGLAGEAFRGTFLLDWLGKLSVGWAWEAL